MHDSESVLKNSGLVAIVATTFHCVDEQWQLIFSHFMSFQKMTLKDLCF